MARNKLIHEGNVKFRSDDIYALLVQLRDGILNIVQRVENYPDLTGWVTLIDEAKFSTGLNFQPSPAVPSVADSQLDNQEDEG